MAHVAERFMPTADNAADIIRLSPLIHDIAAPAFTALQEFGTHTNQETGRAIAHPMRVAALLHDFTGAHIDTNVYSAAVLHDLGQRVDDDIYGKNSRAALKVFSTDNRIAPADWQYVSALLTDLDVVEEYSESIRAESDIRNQTLSRALNGRGIETSVPVWMWNAPSWMTAPSKMLDMLNKVNLESVLIKSCEALDNLQHPAPKETAVLQDVFDVEAFYAPLCEIMGYDALATALRSQAKQIRLTMSGNTKPLEEAAAILDPFSDRNFIYKTVGSIHTMLAGGSAMVEHSVDDHANHQIILGDSLLETDAASGELETFRSVWRLKTLGSIATKLAQGKPVPDVLGITLVTADDQAKLVDLYATVADNVAGGIEAGILEASDEDDAFDVRGSDEFTAAVQNGFASDSLVPENIKSKTTENGYEVAKVTFKLPVIVAGARLLLPVEVQVQTETGRLVSRRDTAWHGSYKADGKLAAESFDASVLHAIFERKQALATQQRADLVDGSLARAEMLRNKIKKSRWWSYDSAILMKEKNNNDT